MNRRVDFFCQSGQSLVELLVAFSITALLLPALFLGFTSSREGKVQRQERFLATVRVREAKEALRVIRDRGWPYISVNGTYHPVLAGTTWTLAPGAEDIDGQTRSIVISDSYRDPSGALVDTPGTVDPSIKKITVSVSWSALFPSSIVTTFYLARFSNLSWIQTTQEEFDAGVKTGVVTTNVQGGEVTLGAGGSQDWCSPTLSILATDLPKQGVANAISVIEGKAFAGTGDNASGVSYATVTVSNDDSPQATVSGTFDGYKTNDIFGETNYAYLATDTNAKEIEIVDLASYNPATGKYAEAGYFDAPGNGDGASVYVSGNIGFMTTGNIFHSFDLSSKSGSRPVIDSNGVTLAGSGKSIMVVGDYAYVAIDSSSTQLQIIDIRVPSNLTVVGSASVPGGDGVDVFVNASGTRAYMATESSLSQREMFIVDITTKTGAHGALGSYEANGMNPKGVTVVPGNKAILVGSGGTYQYQVIDIANEGSPVLCTSGGRSGGLAIASGVRGIASVVEADGDAYSFIITGDANAEFKIIEGGPGGQYATNGVFESDIFEALQAASFNRFTVNHTKPANTNIEYQVAGSDQAGGSCTGASFSYVGPDGTANTRFSTGSAIPLSSGPGYKNPAQCFRYKVFLTSSDTVSSPVFNDILVNYSP